MISGTATTCRDGESINPPQFPMLICCVIRQITLDLHIKTVVGYLNGYRNASPEEQEKYARCFSSYLLVFCWRKMHSRIVSWPAVGIIQGLDSILTNNSVMQAIDDFAWDSLSNKRGRGDRTLAKVLAAAAATGTVIPDIIKLLPDNHQSIAKLLEVVNCAVMDEHYHIYNKDTALDFHRLLVGTLIGWARSLENLKIAKMVSKRHK